MGIKLGLAITAVGLAVTLHAYYKNKKEKQQLSQQQQQSALYSGGEQPHGQAGGGSHSFLKPLAGALGVGAAGYAAHHYLSHHHQSNSSGSGHPQSGSWTHPQQQLPPPPPPPSYDHRPTLRDPAAIYHHLCEACVQKQLQAFYPPSNPRTLRRLADDIAAAGTLEQLANAWHLPDALALDLVRLALFDVILLVDDSASMVQGTSMQEMRTICAEVAWIASLFDTTGIDVRFFNSMDQGNNLSDPRQVEDLLNRNRPFGRTPMGASLRDKILRPMTLHQARKNNLWKPQLIIVFTDGASTDASRDTPPRVISKARSKLERTRYGKDCVFFSFAQVGQDRGATRYLSDLDEDPYIGGSIDVTSSTQYEVQQVLDTLKRDSRGIPPQWQPLLNEELSPDSPLWTALFRVKRLVGAIHPWYDQTDEQPKKRRRFSLSSSRSEASFKPHWSEEQDYIQNSTSHLQAFGYAPYPVPQPPMEQFNSSAPAPPPNQWTQAPQDPNSMPPAPVSTSSFDLSTSAGTQQPPLPMRTEGQGDAASYYSSFGPSNQWDHSAFPRAPPPPPGDYGHNAPPPASYGQRSLYY